MTDRYEKIHNLTNNKTLYTLKVIKNISTGPMFAIRTSFH